MTKRRLALRLVACVVVLAGLWFAVRGMSRAELFHALAAARVPFLAVTCLPLLAIGSVLRTERYRALLPAPTPRFLDLWSAVVVSAAANNVLPLRAGELVRTHQTAAAGVPLPRVAVAQVLEKVVEACTLVLWSTPAVATFAGFRRPTLVVALVLLPLSVIVTWAARRYGAVDLTRLAASAAWSLVADAVEIAIIAACLAGLGLPAGIIPSVTVFAAVNLAIALPSTPGNLGALEAGAALPLIAMGTPHDGAVAFAVVYRAIQWFPSTALGAVLMASRTRVRAS